MVKKLITNKKIIRKSNKKKSILGRIKGMFTNIFSQNKKVEDFSHIKNLIICNICQKVIVEPRITKCSHIFCALCIHEYLFLFDNCLVCKKYINPLDELLMFNNLNNIINSFLNNSNNRIKADFKNRKSEFNKYMKEKIIIKFEKFQIIDILSNENVWSKGIIVKLYEKNQKVESIKVNIKDDNVIIKLKSNSFRISNKEFYTSRTDLPKFEFMKNGNKKLILNNMPFKFKNKKDYINIEDGYKLFIN